MIEPNNMSAQIQVVENGNRFVNVPHIFVDGRGTFYPSKDIALTRSHSPNGVMGWVETFKYNGAEYFQAGYTNTFD